MHQHYLNKPMVCYCKYLHLIELNTHATLLKNTIKRFYNIIYAVNNFFDSGVSVLLFCLVCGGYRMSDSRCFVCDIAIVTHNRLIITCLHEILIIIQWIDVEKLMEWLLDSDWCEIDISLI